MTPLYPALSPPRETEGRFNRLIHARGSQWRRHCAVRAALRTTSFYPGFYLVAMIGRSGRPEPPYLIHRWRVPSGPSRHDTSGFRWPGSAQYPLSGHMDPTTAPNTKNRFSLNMYRTQHMSTLVLVVVTARPNRPGQFGDLPGHLRGGRAERTTEAPADDAPPWVRRAWSVPGLCCSTGRPASCGPLCMTTSLA